MQNERERNVDHVLRTWVSAMTWKMQSVLFSALRGPDNRRCPALKDVVRFLRLATQNDAGVTTEDSYMDVADNWNLTEIKREVEYLSVHYASHLLYGLEIVGYKHPDAKLAKRSLDLYSFLVADWHLNTETESQLDDRLA